MSTAASPPVEEPPMHQGRHRLVARGKVAGRNDTHEKLAVFDSSPRFIWLAAEVSYGQQLVLLDLTCVGWTYS